jgi:hypothetical protein
MQHWCDGCVAVQAERGTQVQHLMRRRLIDISITSALIMPRSRTNVNECDGLMPLTPLEIAAHEVTHGVTE